MERSEWTSSSGATGTSAWAAWATKSARAEVSVTSGWFVALAERIEAIGERQHEVSREGVVHRIVDVVGCHGACYVGALLKQVVCFESKRGLFPFQELI